MDNKIKNMQANLKLIRDVLGWSINKLAYELGCSKQTIINLEKGLYKMSKTQYLAMRYLLLLERGLYNITSSQYVDLMRMLNGKMRKVVAYEFEEES